MADSTVAALTAASALTGTELFYGVQSANDVKITASQIATFTGGGGGGGMAIGGGITSATLGSVLFAGASGVLAQDNANFFWDTTTHNLIIGGSYYIGTEPALYTISGNWFEGNAGNHTVTGSANFGTGDFALALLTSGSHNVAIGTQSQLHTDTGSDNLSFGFFALQGCTSGSSNTAVGSLALQQCSTGVGNTAIGNQSLNHVTTGNANTCVGSNVMAQGIIIGQNVGIGNNLLDRLGVFGSSETDNVCIGAASLRNVDGATANVSIGSGIATNMGSGNFNTFIGFQAFGGSTGSCTKNTMIGNFQVGGNITNGSYNTLLANWAGPAGTMSNVVALSDGAGTLLLDYGYTNASTWTFAAPYMTTPVATSALPAAGVVGRRAFVNDATATTFASVVAGTGSNKVPVYDDGTNWRIG